MPRKKPLSVSALQTHARLLSTEKGAKVTGINTKQAKTINVTWATVHVQSMTRTSNGAYSLTRPCAARSTHVYLERGGAPRCTRVHWSVKLPFQRSYRGSRWTLSQLRCMDPGVRSNSAWRNYVILGASEAPTCCLASGRRKTKRGWSPGDSLIFSSCTFR